MTSCDITRRALSLGVAQDTITGWYSKSFAETVIKGIVRPRNQSIYAYGVGLISRYGHTFFTQSDIAEGDEIKDANGNYYVIQSVQEEWLGDSFSHYVCEATKRQTPLRPATSGTWHLDSDALTTDPRSRTKVYLDAYLTAASLKEDDGATNATYIICFEGATYPVNKVFLTKTVDLIFSIGEETTTSEDTIYDVPYKDIVSVPVTISAINKSGITPTNLVEQAEKEIQLVLDEHPFNIGSTSKRSLSSSRPSRVELGDGSFLWQKTVTIKYTRSNDDHVATLPTITWGPSATPTGTFIFPNVINKQERYVSNDVFLDIPGRSGSYPQAFGTRSLEVELTCDLDMEHTDLTWKRSAAAPWQSSAVKVENHKLTKP
jgi:hypothetical protein